MPKSITGRFPKGIITDRYGNKVVFANNWYFTGSVYSRIGKNYPIVIIGYANSIRSPHVQLPTIWFPRNENIWQFVKREGVNITKRGALPEGDKFTLV